MVAFIPTYGSHTTRNYYNCPGCNKLHTSGTTSDPCHNCDRYTYTGETVEQRPKSIVAIRAGLNFLKSVWAILRSDFDWQVSVSPQLRRVENARNTQKSIILRTARRRITKQWSGRNFCKQTN